MATITFSKKQMQVINALRKPGAYMVAPFDLPGHRTGYVTTSGLKGWDCSVSLATKKILEKCGVIVQSHYGDHFRIHPDFKL